jgi:hypothetical protein
MRCLWEGRAERCVILLQWRCASGRGDPSPLIRRWALRIIRVRFQGEARRRCDALVQDEDPSSMQSFRQCA